MIIDSLNLNHLRIFECVYRTRSMTTAAQELHLTQSGVSQHIRALEEVLGIRLFDRIKQRLIPTASATTLFKQSQDSLYGIEQALLEIKGGVRQLSGTISIGMPIEFGNNVILPLLAKFCKEQPRVRFALRFGFATQMNDDILRGELDFAFVDAFSLDRRIETKSVYQEVLMLCAAKSLPRPKAAARENKAYFESLEYVDYQAGEPLLRMWFAHHLGTKSLNLNVRATVMDVQGIARLILSGLAVGVLPGHLATKLQKEGQELHQFKGCGKPLRNGISVAYLSERTQSAASRATLDWLMGELKATGPKSE